MAAGDAHRVWFPEMVEHLRLRWQDDLSTEALLARDQLDDMLVGAFARRGTSSTRFSSVLRVGIGRGADPHVSVRATILALARFGVAAREPARALAKAWTTYRRRRDWTCMATLRRRNPLNSQGARTPMRVNRRRI
jgi:hypothetical protein